MSSQDLMPNKIPHAEAVFVGVTTVFTFLSTVAVILRFTSRILTLSIKWDDWACLGALLLAYGSFVTITLAATVAHGGYNTSLYGMATLEKYMQVRYISSPIFNLDISFQGFPYKCFHSQKCPMPLTLIDLTSSSSATI